jgi:hypothetical protein
MVAMTLAIAKISRLTKIFAEKKMGSFEQAGNFFAKQILIIHLDEKAANTLAGQAAALTAVATASRAFLGGVELSGALGTKLLLGLPFETIGEAAKAFGARPSADGAYTVFVGDVPPGYKGHGIQGWWDRWRAGIRPTHSPQPQGGGRVSLAGIAAAAVAVSQAFSFIMGNKIAGWESWDVNLWDPTDKTSLGPEHVRLPLNLWFIGMGNLGQAYLWSLMLLPFKSPKNIQPVFQDMDHVKEENIVTSILATETWVGKRKTLLAADWALKRGFDPKIWDFALNEKFQNPVDDPFYALAGLDSMDARKLLSYCKFPYLLNAGLGSTSRNDHAFDLERFDEKWGPNDCYKDTVAPKDDLLKENLKLDAYQEQICKGDHVKCGMYEIAESSAAVPFVSAFVGALAITRTIQLASGIRPYRVLSGSTVELVDLRVVSEPEFGKHEIGIYSEGMDCA